MEYHRQGLRQAWGRGPTWGPFQKQETSGFFTGRGEMRPCTEKWQSMQICLQSYFFSQYFMDPVLCGSHWWKQLSINLYLGFPQDCQHFQPQTLAGTGHNPSGLLQVLSTASGGCTFRLKSSPAWGHKKGTLPPVLQDSSRAVGGAIEGRADTVSFPVWEPVAYSFLFQSPSVSCAL